MKLGFTIQMEIELMYMNKIIKYFYITLKYFML